MKMQRVRYYLVICVGKYGIYLKYEYTFVLRVVCVIMKTTDVESLNKINPPRFM